MPTAPPSAIRLAPSANRVRVERPVVVRKIIDASPFRAISRPRRALEHGRTGGPISPASAVQGRKAHTRSEEHTSELQSLMRISYAVFCLKKKNRKHTRNM